MVGVFMEVRGDTSPGEACPLSSATPILLGDIYEI